MEFQKGSTIVMKGIKRGNLYVLQGTTCVNAVSVFVASKSDKDIPDSTQLWHMRLGHMSERGMMTLQKQKLLGNQKLNELKFCEHCVFGKQHRIKFPKVVHTTKGTLDYIHADCWGPSRVLSLGGGRYFLSIIDDYSRMTWIYIISHKNQAFRYFKEWKALMENQTGKKIKRFRTNNGLEFCSAEFNTFCKDKGIVRQLTVRNTPQQNGVAERMNKTLLERTRCLLSNAEGVTFWGEAVNTTCFLINRTPSTAISLKTPIEIWTGKPTNYSNLRVFGCNAYYHVNEGKLLPRSRKCLFMGYGDGVKGYRIWSPSEKKVILSRDVIFDESHLFHPKLEVPITATHNSHPPQVGKVESISEKTEDKDLLDKFSEASQEEEQSENSSANESHQNAEPDSIQLNPGISQKPKRVIKPPERYGFEDMATYALHAAEEIDSDEPTTYKEAISHPEAEKWILAMREEMESLYKNQTWKLVELPKGRHVVGCKWIYKKKSIFSEKEEIRYKARLVAKGFSQKEGVDFNEIFSPVVRHTSIRVLLAIVANQDMELEQLDVKTAFLHGRLEENILMKQPEGFEVQGKEGYVCQLQRSLYGLKQSPR
uniref:Retrovirus-related Pol polyprotein from transposon TNT 1-94 n=1 Tax=Cajanus cajan TaxID=3821 RepID=A0A151T5R0_CAJCA|nr:Retrovirus-related Pol polyprotein from transposon TNT 1-94 [Cajanus cajan]